MHVPVYFMQDFWRGLVINNGKITPTLGDSQNGLGFIRR